MSMCALNRVESARKAPGKCGECQKEIAVGEPYLWWKGRNTGKRVRCILHPPKPWQRETNPVKADYLEAEYTLPSPDDEITHSEAEESLTTTISLIESVYDTLQERVDAWEQTNLANSYQCEATRDTAGYMEDWISSANDVATRLVDAIEAGADQDDEEDGVSAILSELEPLPDLDLGA